MMNSATLTWYSWLALPCTISLPVLASVVNLHRSDVQTTDPCWCLMGPVYMTKLLVLFHMPIEQVYIHVFSLYDCMHVPLVHPQILAPMCYCTFNNTNEGFRHTCLPVGLCRGH